MKIIHALLIIVCFGLVMSLPFLNCAAASAAAAAAAARGVRLSAVASAAAVACGDIAQASSAASSSTQNFLDGSSLASAAASASASGSSNWSTPFGRGHKKYTATSSSASSIHKKVIPQPFRRPRPFPFAPHFPYF